jgi:peptide/nickel transport system substrate-binding protein
VIANGNGVGMHGAFARHRPRVSVVAAVCAVALLTAGCGGGSGTTTGGASPTGANATLVADTAFTLKTPDPARNYETTGNLVLHSLYDTLVSFKGADVKDLVPGLAASWEVSRDAKTFTFHLRPGVTFSDGTKLTSKDVVYSLRRVQNLKGSPAFLLDGISLAAPDPKTVVLTSEKATNALLYELTNPSLGIMNSKVLAAHGGTDAKDAATADHAESFLRTASLGTGPYMLKSWSTTSEVVVAANPHYWGAKPKYTRVVVRNVPASTQKLNLQTGSSQLALDLSPQLATGLRGDIAVTRADGPTPIYLSLFGDAGKFPVTSNPSIQKAIRYGLDYDGLVQVAGEGAKQAAGIIPSVFAGALPDDQAIHRDVAAAKQAVAASGIRRPKFGLAYPTDVQTNGVSYQPLAERVQSNLKEVGIEVDLRPSPYAVSHEEYKEAKQEAGFQFWGADWPAASNYLAFLPGQLVGERAGWAATADPALAKLGDELEVAPDVDVAGYQKLQQRLNEQSPFVPLIQPAAIVASAKSVSGPHYNAVWTIAFAELG